jgi:hypothetical protein
MERAPMSDATNPVTAIYPPPKSEMAKHINELVAFLRDGHSGRAEFLYAINSAVAHADYLEDRCVALAADNIAMRDHLAIPFPMAMSVETYASHAVPFERIFEWRLQPISWQLRVSLPESRYETADKFRKLRWQTLRSAFKMVRKQVETAMEDLARRSRSDG